MESKVYIDPYPKTMKMLGLERINIDCGNNTSIVTPANIAKDMVALLPDEVFIPESKFLDICCKSGIFLTSIREKLMNSKSMIESFPDYKERYKYITNNQIYGIAPNGQCQMYSVRAVYGTLKVDNPHILCFGAFDQYRTACLNNNHKMLIDEMKKEFGQMKFDVVIGNPPYNKDIYLDFVTLGHTLANKYDCWITPAKWQAKGGQKNEDFRKNIVPYMSTIVYYPNSGDVFDIVEKSGISCYLISANKNISKTVIKNIDKFENHPGFNSDFEVWGGYTLYNQKVASIINKCNGIVNNIKLNFKDHNKYNVIGTLMLSFGGGSNRKTMWSTTGTLNAISELKIVHQKNLDSYGNNFKYYYCNSDIKKCESFISYCNTRIIRFLVFIGCCGDSISNTETWRFVPAPEAFDHIFTDQELYKKYNLTDEEINIIESVIKERK